VRPLALALALAATLAVRGQAPADSLFEKFFAAESPADALSAADQLVAAGLDFDTAYARLKKGRFYGDEAEDHALTAGADLASARRAAL